MALIDNIQAYWKLDGNSNDSASTNNGTDTNISYVAGKIGNAASFNGSSSRISVGTGLNITGELTLNAWVYINNYTGYNWIIAKYANDSSITYDWRVDITSGKQNFASNSNNKQSTSEVGTGGWKMLTVTRDASNNLAFYLNGVADGTPGASAAANAAAGTNVYIGTRGDLYDFMDGIVDELGVWSRALSSTEISQLYNSGAGLTYPFSTGDTVNPAKTTTSLGLTGIGS